MKKKTMIITTITITDEQKKLVDNADLNLSRFVRRVLNKKFNIGVWNKENKLGDKNSTRTNENKFSNWEDRGNAVWKFYKIL